MGARRRRLISHDTTLTFLISVSHMPRSFVFISISGQGDTMVLEGYGILFQDLGVTETGEGWLVGVESASSIMIKTASTSARTTSS